MVLKGSEEKKQPPTPIVATRSRSRGEWGEGRKGQDVWRLARPGASKKQPSRVAGPGGGAEKQRLKDGRRQPPSTMHGRQVMRAAQTSVW